MTPANKKQLTEFVAFARAPTGAQAHYSNAFREAFRLLAHSGNGSDRNPEDKMRGYCVAVSGDYRADACENLVF